ncbi:MAG: hypothetical protein IJC71_01705 [Clostridia bacterium]|nr:hypothetical protein [Clostridia bacterium]
MDTFADLAAVPVDLARGDYISAALSALGAIPVVGEIADTAKIARAADKAVDAAKSVSWAAEAVRAVKASKSAKTTGIAIDTLKKLKNQPDHKVYKQITRNIAERSPMRIPKNASVKYKDMKSGYDQIEYRWKRGVYDYTARWHTHTPGAPEYSQTTWVIERRIKGIGYGKNRLDAKNEYLIGKNKWISKQEWNAARKARGLNKETPKTRRILDSGHWEGK